MVRRTDAWLIRRGAAIVDHTRRNRRHRDRDRFPLTGGWIKHTSPKTGGPVGRDCAYAIQHALLDHGIIEVAGHYEQRRFGVKTGAKVTLYRLGKGYARLRKGALRATPVSVPGRKRETAWWQHPLFGFGAESYPGSLPKRLRQWLEPPDWQIAWLTDEQ